MENTFEPSVSNLIHLVGVCIEIFGVFIILAGIVWSTLLFAQQRNVERYYDQYKIRIGRSLLLGLEAIELTYTSLGLLAGLVVVRTFLSWTLVLEIEDRWPWQRELLPMNAVRDARD